jgi:phosphoesterase RecJ-like protein
MSTKNGDVGAAVECLRSAKRALLTGHRRPDGDSLGSQLALAELAQRLGVETVIVNRDPAPTSLSELPGSTRIVVGATPPADFPSGFDLVVTLECADLERTGLDGLDRLPILNIDHHPANPGFGEVNYLDEASPAVGEMVWQMFAAAGVVPSPDAATNSYVALSTDTGDFRYSNTSGRAFRAAAEMVEAGADPTLVAEWVHGRRSAASVRLLGEALNNMTLECDGKIATIELDEAAFQRNGASPSDTDEIINLPRSIVGVEAVVFFKQWEAGVVNVSLRSKGTVDVREIAARFGGGGHVNASGCSLHCDLAEARRKMTCELAEKLECGR